jgi:fatty-acyl-CoA synthase
MDDYDLLPKTPANFAALSPVSFLPRAAELYPDRLAVIHGSLRRTWSQLEDRVMRLAGAMRAHGIGRNDTVSAMLPNIPEMIELHFAVPMVNAVLHTINTRLDAAAVAFQLQHAQARLIFVDREFAAVMRAALAHSGLSITVVDIDDANYAGGGEAIGQVGYEDFIAQHPPAAYALPQDEWDAIALSYTSGTTGDPKGVVTHHRGAYLNALGNIVTWAMPHHPVYLWTLPMFHCNGWCFPWTLAAVAGTQVCLRRVEAPAILAAMAEHRVTHYCGAPIVHAMIANADPRLQQSITHRVSGMVAGAAPPASLIEAMDRMGFDITHVYGLTEVYGPASVCARQDAWAPLPIAERARLNARQGVRYAVEEGMQVLDPVTLAPMPRDGQTMGEIMFRGNVVMKGYLKNPSATQAAFAGGWFHSGDLAVCDADGYVKIKDRSKDIIISGGENISSIEVEDVLYRHPAVIACAVVAKADAKWGETPVAFVELRPDVQVSAAEIIAHCREHLASYKCPRDVRFAAIPRTSTGKIQKFALRKALED